MVKLTGLENMGSVKIGGQIFSPDEKGCLYIPDDCPTEVLEALRSHGYTLVGWVKGPDASDPPKAAKKAAQPES